MTALNGHGCRHCSRNAKITDEDYKELERKYGGRLLHKANLSDKPSKWKCPRGCIFYRSYSSIKLSGNFCSSCSKGLSERILQSVFEQIFQAPFVKTRLIDLRGVGGSPLELDLYNSNLKIAVEHQGAHHYRPQSNRGGKKAFNKIVKHDKLKQIYCKKNQIKLIVIEELFSRTYLENLKSVIQQKCKEQSIALPKNYKRLNLNLNYHSLNSIDEMHLSNLRLNAEARNYKLLSKKWHGVHYKYSFECPQKHKFTMGANTFKRGVNCGFCYETSKYSSVVLSNGKLFLGQNMAARYLGVDSGSVDSATKRAHRVKNYFVLRITREQYKIFKNNPQKKWIWIKKNLEKLSSKRLYKSAVILSNGKMFASQGEAGRFLKVSSSTVSAATKRTNGTIYGIGVKSIDQSTFSNLNKGSLKIRNLISRLWPEGVVIRQMKRKPVIASDGREFESLSDAARQLSVSQSYVSTAIKYNKKINGIKLRFKR